ESSFDEKEGVRHLVKLDLMEVSPVTFPANDEARVDAVKGASLLAKIQNKFAAGVQPTARDIEALLREAGASKTVAAKTAAAFADAYRGEPGAEAVEKALAAADRMTAALRRA